MPQADAHTAVGQDVEHPKGRVLGQPSDLSLQLPPATLKAGPYSPALCHELAEPAREGVAAAFNNDGQNQSAMSYHDIWEYIAEDTEDAEEKALFEALGNTTEANAAEKPFYNGSIRIVESGEKILADLVWPEKKVAFFLKENAEQFSEAQKTNWTVFCMEKPFSADDIIRALCGG